MGAVYRYSDKQVSEDWKDYIQISLQRHGVSSTAVLEGPKCSSSQRRKRVNTASPRETEKQRNRKKYID